MTPAALAGCLGVLSERMPKASRRASLIVRSCPFLLLHLSKRGKMPSDLSYWLISAPLKDGDPNTMLDEVRQALGTGTMVSGWEIPELKVSPFFAEEAIPYIGSYMCTISKSGSCASPS